jgi:16S rRNA (cytidine1402-2'-O)-methyltransferase
VSYHEHNERRRTLGIVEKLSQGHAVALLSDAGTPTISDPGFRLVRECHRRHIAVVPIPGACAIPVAICASGLPSHGFLFLGFLPPRAVARGKIFHFYQNFPYTLVLYESCHRVAKVMDEIITIFGEDRQISICQELTKLHEFIFSGRALDAQQFLKTNGERGEFVLLIAPKNFLL